MYSQDELKESILSGFYEYNPDSSENFKSSLVLNDTKSGKKSLEFILENLENCNSFRFSVAFITSGGVSCLRQVLMDLVKDGRGGQIIFSKYQNFTDPKAIEQLMGFEGIELKFSNEFNYHGKTYLFDYGEFSRLLIGSSNLTQDGLGRNTEVNLGISFDKRSSIHSQLLDEFSRWEANAISVNKENLLEYKNEWLKAREVYSTSTSQTSCNAPMSVILPNKMQEEALIRLGEMRKHYKSRALLISATGTGKTVLSAFDVKNANFKRMLFAVHRLNIAKKALEEFRKVFGFTKSMGIYSSGDELNKDADFIFTTIQTLSRDDHLIKFNENDFDYIIIDETHRAGAKSYEKIIDYFKPKFLLGMTATPERTDGYDIFKLFNHDIAYEIRLNGALEADLLTPFHYYGVSELEIDGEVVGDDSNFNKLVSNQRVSHILNTLEKYPCDSGEPRGLIFCSRKEEAKDLCLRFNEIGIKSVCITGESTEQERTNAINNIQEDGSSKIDYIFTVDVFNEGIDIPKINQVIMLRPTSSPIIFVQQLGRGLRKAKDKEFLTVIDFIGNYNNNYMIPIALFGDSSYDKDKLRGILSAGNGLIPGASSISFDRIAKEKIFDSINTANLNTKRSLVEDYKLLSYRLGKRPLMMDFFKNEFRDPYQYVNYSGSFLAFTKIIHNDVSTSETCFSLLKYFGKVCNGTRVFEPILLELLISKNEITVQEFREVVLRDSRIKITDEEINSTIHNLNLNYITEKKNNSIVRVSELFVHCIAEYDNTSEVIHLNTDFSNLLHCRYFLDYLLDLLSSAKFKFLKGFKTIDYVGGFVLGRKYSREDVFHLLNWDKKPVAQNVGGYKISEDGKNCAIFLTYEKKAEISESTKYEDRFLNPGHLIYMSKSRRTLNSNDVKTIISQSVSGIRLPLFVQKNNDEGTSFYFLGNMSALEERFEETVMTSGDKVVKMEFKLEKEVNARLYKYLVE
jgi:superfamily II DNA or RNA helicase/HKD family nuclease